MYANTLNTQFTRLREDRNQSIYKNTSLSTNVRKEMRFSHSLTGKATDPYGKMSRHLLQVETEVQPTLANGLKKPEKVTVNLTIAHSDGVPIIAGTGDFAHLNIVENLIQVVQALVKSDQTATVTGNVSVTSFINGEI